LKRSKLLYKFYSHQPAIVTQVTLINNKETKSAEDGHYIRFL